LKTKRSSLFITFEGIDGVGKTTCLRNVEKLLQKADIDVLVTKLPGDKELGSDIGAGLRQLLFFEPSTKGMAPGVADLLYLADSIQCTQNIIIPALNRGMTVLCDRYTDSQRAYSMDPAKKTPKWANDAHDLAPLLEPDLTILLVCEPEHALARSRSRGGADAAKQDGKAWDGAQYLIQGAYLGLLRNLPRTRMIDVDGKDADTVAEKAYGHIIEEMMYG
jgi:dTMP kinase